MGNAFRLQADPARMTVSAAPSVVRSGEHCSMAELQQLMGYEPGAASAGEVVLLPMRRLHAGDSLYHEGAPAQAIYFVRAGTFKTYRTAEDGYEQVLGFAGRAEVLGFDSVCMDRHPTAAVALEESSVYVVLVRDLFTTGPRSPTLDRIVAIAVSRALTQRGDLADLMAAVAAEVRLARFLVQLSKRMAGCGQSPRRFHLRMSRRDIASHLGVAHETVSRSFSALAGWGLVQVDNREVEIIDMERLKVLARSTRGTADEPRRVNGSPLSLVQPAKQPRGMCEASP